MPDYGPLVFTLGELCLDPESGTIAQSVKTIDVSDFLILSCHRKQRRQRQYIVHCLFGHLALSEERGGMGNLKSMLDIICDIEEICESHLA